MKIRNALLLAACLVLGLAAMCPRVRAEETDARLRPDIEAPTGESIIYGQSLAESALVGGAATDPVSGREVDGYFVWSNVDFVPGLGLQQCMCEFIPSGFDAEYFLPVSFRAEVEVCRIPVHIAQAPVCLRHIEYGESIDRAGLFGGVCADPYGAEVPGTWLFSDGGRMPAAGTVSAAAVFVPEDSFHYEEARCAVEVECDPCTPCVSVFCTRALPGMPLSACLLDGWAAGLCGALIPGVFAFRDASVVPPGDAGLYDVTFTPEDSANYLPVTVKVPVVFGLRDVNVEAILEVGEGQKAEEGILTWLAYDDEGLSVAGDLLLDERFSALPVGAGESVGALFIPQNTAVYSEIPVSVRVTLR